jgi:hypothetical protein
MTTVDLTSCCGPQSVFSACIAHLACAMPASTSSAHLAVVQVVEDDELERAVRAEAEARLARIRVGQRGRGAGGRMERGREARGQRAGGGERGERERNRGGEHGADEGRERVHGALCMD